MHTRHMGLLRGIEDGSYEFPEFMKKLVYYPRDRAFFQCCNAEISLSSMKMISSHG